MLHRRRWDLHFLSEKERKPRLACACAPEDKQKQMFLNKISFEKPDTQLRLKLNPFFSYARLAFRHAKEEVSGEYSGLQLVLQKMGLFPPPLVGPWWGLPFPHLSLFDWMWKIAEVAFWPCCLITILWGFYSGLGFSLFSVSQWRLVPPLC